MAHNINLNDVEINFKIDNLYIQMAQLSYGVFTTSFPKHQHGRNFYEIHLVCDGKGTLITDEKKYPLEKGHLYLTGPNIAHEQLNDLESPMSEYCMSFVIHKINKLPNTSLSSILYDTHFWFGQDHHHECLNLFERLADEALQKNIGYTHNIQSILSCLLVALARNYSGYAKTTAHYYSSPDNKRMLIIDSCFLYQYATLTEKALCSSLNLSARQLQRFLKEHYSKSFSQMKREARLSKAAELISQGVPIETAATLVGYNDVSFFKKLYSSYNASN